MSATEREERARLAPLPPEQWSDEARAALEAAFPGATQRFLSGDADAPPLPNVLATLMHHPALAGPFLAYNNVLLREPELAPRLRELMILRVAWRAHSPYEWVQHTRIAVEVGIKPEEIEALSRDPDDPPWPPLERALLAAADELLDHQRITDTTWAQLAEHLDERQLIEVVFTIGTYTCLAMAFNSFGLQLDPGLEPPAKLPVPE